MVLSAFLDLKWNCGLRRVKKIGQYFIILIIMGSIDKKLGLNDSSRPAKNKKFKYWHYGTLHPKKISSGVDNWYLDEFFEEYICGR
jgi:hypothetical protein